MKGRTLVRHFKESFKSIGRNSWMTFASVSAVTVTLLLVGVFVLIMMNLNKVADDLENDVEIKVFVSLDASEETVQNLESKITEMPGVESTNFSTKEEELTDLVLDFGDELSLFEQSNPLFDVFYVKALDPQQTEKVATDIAAFEHIEDVKYGEGKIEKLFNFLNAGRNVGLILILALLFTAMFLISNTIRITIVARRREIEIMKLVGATNWFVRIPFILEGMWLGLLGSIIPIGLVALLYSKITEFAQPRLSGELFQLLEFTPFIYQVSALILLMGVFIGIWGSFMSIRKFLRV
ncbi:permease-like cell division protein FtsX [Microbacterium sp. APC 3898]|uniref:Cell division protein FtsX n=2 Tax=Planococcus TaxID=1372 RepID=A0ABT7ZG45_9BACL|nr:MULTISPECIES: permease-like cell division protein FtsX [Terrabacteria group]MBF6633392.1 ABC transporter permease [Planococcus sp. (in: firmicutes)]MBD8013606.1 ABC transporter permease [Planococcus wigleyi]MDN3425908.1 permease-like cell division protein FtsX [Planococcus sp. APC 4016]MDN3437502.1 permease-like cell division protein FtsX [Planococcus sp. APC 3900]MDN3497605.1 permease-like cell division protein FtsX [Microbacterium sp. APC 3898]